MTTFFTYADLTTKIINDLTLDGEDFVEPDELLGYANEALRAVEAEIHSLNEDYFLRSASVKSASGMVTGLVSGQEKYDLPADIYAHKIRRIVYKNGTTVFPIERFKDWKKFEKLEESRAASTGTVVYNYLIENAIVGQPQIVFAPVPRETGDFVQIWYLRTVNKFTGDDADVCDVPEFINFVLQYVKVRCYEKEIGHPNLAKSMQDLMLLKQQMAETLTAMVPDAENEIEADFSFYADHS